MMEIEFVRPVPPEVKSSEYGCRNCLWFCLECLGGSSFQAAPLWEGHPTCANYMFYD